MPRRARRFYIKASAHRRGMAVYAEAAARSPRRVSALKAGCRSPALPISSSRAVPLRRPGIDQIIAQLACLLCRADAGRIHGLLCPVPRFDASTRPVGASARILVITVELSTLHLQDRPKSLRLLPCSISATRRGRPDHPEPEVFALSLRSRPRWTIVGADPLDDRRPRLRMQLSGRFGPSRGTARSECAAPGRRVGAGPLRQLAVHAASFVRMQSSRGGPGAEALAESQRSRPLLDIFPTLPSFRRPLAKPGRRARVVAFALDSPPSSNSNGPTWVARGEGPRNSNGRPSCPPTTPPFWRPRAGNRWTFAPRRALLPVPRTPACALRWLASLRRGECAPDRRLGASGASRRIWSSGSELYIGPPSRGSHPRRSRNLLSDRGLSRSRPASTWISNSSLTYDDGELADFLRFMESEAGLGWLVNDLTAIRLLSRHPRLAPCSAFTASSAMTADCRSALLVRECGDPRGATCRTAARASSAIPFRLCVAPCLILGAGGRSARRSARRAASHPSLSSDLWAARHRLRRFPWMGSLGH